MAKATNLRLFLGEDHQFVFTTLNAAETLAVDITGWTLSWMIKRYTSDADLSALLEKTTAAGIAISGVFNSVPATNTQVATVTILDTETSPLPEVLAQYELKRMDAGFETVLAYGTLELVRAVHA
jgi:hypothetical protein